MKSLLAVSAVALWVSTLCVASPLDPPPTYPVGVAEVKWGASPKEADKVMLARPGVKRWGEVEGRVRYLGGTLADQPVEKWELIFTGGKFTEAMIWLKAREPLRQYESVRKMITEKYRKKGREERENSIHRATYWEYSTDRGKWGIACDVTANTLVLVYKDKTPPPPPRKQGPRDL